MANSFIFNGEPGRNRTYDPLIKSQLLCQLSYRPYTTYPVFMARLGGLEPPTPGFGGRCSNPLSYRRSII